MTLHSVICACLLTGEKMGTLNTPEMRGGNDHIFDLPYLVITQRECFNIQ